MKNSSIKKTAILLVSTGNSCPESRKKELASIKTAVAEQFPDYSLREAFTSRRIIEKLKTDYGLVMDSVEQAVEHAAADHIRVLVVLPLHLMYGQEYGNLVRALKGWEQKFDRIVSGKPLLADDADLKAVGRAVVKRTREYDDGWTAICLVGHGVCFDGHEKGADASGSVYIKIQDSLAQAGYDNYYIGTIKGEPSLEGILKKLKENGRYRRVVLQPFMVSAASHARRDIAGVQDGSWRRILEHAGYEVVCILEGLGQIPEIRDIYVEHARKAAGADSTGILECDKQMQG